MTTSMQLNHQLGLSAFEKVSLIQNLHFLLVTDDVWSHLQKHEIVHLFETVFSLLCLQGNDQVIGFRPYLE